jgi:hypothetical protein
MKEVKLKKAMFCVTPGYVKLWKRHEYNKIQ